MQKRSTPTLEEALRALGAHLVMNPERGCNRLVVAENGKRSGYADDGYAVLFARENRNERTKACAGE